MYTPGDLACFLAPSLTSARDHCGPLGSELKDEGAAHSSLLDRQNIMRTTQEPHFPSVPLPKGNLGTRPHDLFMVGVCGKVEESGTSRTPRQACREGPDELIGSVLRWLFPSIEKHSDWRMAG